MKINHNKSSNKRNYSTGLLVPQFGEHGKYTDVGEPHAGGNGVVWTAYDRSKRKVAIKTVKDTVTRDRMAAFVREINYGIEISRARANVAAGRPLIPVTETPNQEIKAFLQRGFQAKLIKNSAFIVEHIDHGEFSARSNEKKKFPFYVMEFVPGGSLGSLIKDKRTTNSSINIRQALAIVAGAARGSQFLRDYLGLLHYDIKTDNIVYDGDKGKLIDLGIARPADVRTWLNSGLLGRLSRLIRRKPNVSGYLESLGYANSQHDVDMASEIYCLGAVLYECLTLEAPPPRVYKAKHLDPAALTRARRWRSLPLGIQGILIMCLGPVRDRCTSAGDLAEILENQWRDIDLQYIVTDKPGIATASSQNPSVFGPIITPSPRQHLVADRSKFKLAAVAFICLTAIVLGLAIAATQVFNGRPTAANNKTILLPTEPTSPRRMPAVIKPFPKTVTNDNDQSNPKERVPEATAAVEIAPPPRKSSDASVVAVEVAPKPREVPAPVKKANPVAINPAGAPKNGVKNQPLRPKVAVPNIAMLAAPDVGVVAVFDLPAGANFFVANHQRDDIQAEIHFPNGEKFILETGHRSLTFVTFDDGTPEGRLALNRDNAKVNLRFSIYSSLTDPPKPAKLVVKVGDLNPRLADTFVISPSAKVIPLSCSLPPKP